VGLGGPLVPCTPLGRFLFWQLGGVKGRVPTRYHCILGDISVGKLQLPPSPFCFLLWPSFPLVPSSSHTPRSSHSLPREASFHLQFGSFVFCPYSICEFWIRTKSGHCQLSLTGNHRHGKQQQQQKQSRHFTTVDSKQEGTLPAGPTACSTSASISNF
jgi:hypothetical protein